MGILSAVTKKREAKSQERNIIGLNLKKEATQVLGQKISQSIKIQNKFYLVLFEHEHKISQKAHHWSE